MQCNTQEQKREVLAQAIKAGAQELEQVLWNSLMQDAQPLEAIEEMVLEGMRALGQQVLAAACAVYASRYPAASVACKCGGKAKYVRRRQGQTKTQLDWIEMTRAYYLCERCGKGQYPLDQQLGFCAGGISAGLDKRLAYLGTMLPFAEAAHVLEEMTGVSVSANRVRFSTEELGSLVAADEQQAIEAAWDPDQPEPAPDESLDPLYISMDGMQVLTREEGWREQLLGSIYTSREGPASRADAESAIRAGKHSYYTSMGDVDVFGKGLWTEAQRRGLDAAKQVVVIGDGAHWIWRLADEHFPQAIQILDWYHVTTYVWKAAHAIYGETSDMGRRWAHKQLDDLWQGRVRQVVRRLRAHVAHKPVQQAISYFNNNRQRMRYPLFRQMGLQIGSGPIESGCKHVLIQRLRQAGMRWSQERLQAVAKLRTRLKSDRWQETLDLRPPPSRSYRRSAA